MAQATRTIDHAEIREWVESLGGQPALARDTLDPGTGILRIDFGEQEEPLEAISWDDFFKIFEDNDLAFLYQDQAPDGSPSYLCKLVSRVEGEDANFADDTLGDLGDLLTEGGVDADPDVDPIERADNF